jgi:hypothetical protein
MMDERPSLIGIVCTISLGKRRELRHGQAGQDKVRERLVSMGMKVAEIP